MSTYIDPAVFKKAGGRKRYAHLTSDTLAELHAFAERIGLGRHFFHAGARHIHYDVPEDLCAAAITAGAVSVSSREMVVLARACRK